MPALRKKRESVAPRPMPRQTTARLAEHCARRLLDARRAPARRPAPPARRRCRLEALDRRSWPPIAWTSARSTSAMRIARHHAAVDGRARLDRQRVFAGAARQHGRHAGGARHRAGQRILVHDREQRRRDLVALGVGGGAHRGGARLGLVHRHRAQLSRTAGAEPRRKLVARQFVERARQPIDRVLVVRHRRVAAEPGRDELKS